MSDLNNGSPQTTPLEPGIAIPDNNNENTKSNAAKATEEPMATPASTKTKKKKRTKTKTKTKTKKTTAKATNESITVPTSTKTKKKKKKKKKTTPTATDEKATKAPTATATAPKYQRVHRGGLDDDDDDDDKKVCRICLEEDSPETMIAPCRCKGGSKWVHRECLDEWRTSEIDRAFSKCTECHFEYHLQPVYNKESEADEESGRSGCCTKPQRRRCLFYYMVFRDVSLGVILQQLIVISLGGIVWLIDAPSRLPLYLPGNKVVVYYGFGWFAFLIALGFYGSIVMCNDGCPNLGPPSERDEFSDTPISEATDPAVRNNSQQKSDSDDNGCDTPVNATLTSKATIPTVQNVSPRERDGDDEQQEQQRHTSRDYYRRARRNHHRNGYFDGHLCCHPVYVDAGNAGSCCGNFHCGDCCCCGGGGGGGDCGDCGGACDVLLGVLLGLAIILATIGFCIGVIFTLVVITRIVGRHIYLLQKRELVKEFQVRDLQQYDLDKPIPKEGEESEERNGRENFGTAPNTAGTKEPPPSAPVIHREDVTYLKKLGLMED